MDPDATWSLLMVAEMVRDRQAMAEHADSLVTWLERWGFLPRWLEAKGYTRETAIHTLRLVRTVAVIK